MPLYLHDISEKKQLNIAGIGTFLIDPQHSSGGISFEYKASVKDDIELISFISSQTGKMKALVLLDLMSYIELGLQFINIGKLLPDRRHRYLSKK